jgi:ABC-type nitrate/sulfonate/bicarbonate transport system substrate-binding protein
MKLKSIAAGVVLALAGANGAFAQQRNIEVILFAGTSALPVYVAKDKGFFEREGVNVNITATPNSGFQMSNLISGKFNIAGTAIDNLIAYMEGQGTAKVDREPDLITIMGLSSTALNIVAQPEYKSIADLKGKEIALDSPTTGFAFVLRNVLEKHGFGVNDTKWVPFGGTRERLNALREKKAAAAMISEPFTTQARAEGFSMLGEIVSVIGPYQANVQIANQPWAKANEDTVVRYIRAMLTAIDWIYDPANKAEAIKILAVNAKIPEAAAAPSIDGVTSGQAAINRKGAIDVEGVRNVIALREKYGVPQKKMGAPEKYYDATWYNKALAK